MLRTVCRLSRCSRAILGNSRPVVGPRNVLTSTPEVGLKLCCPIGLGAPLSYSIPRTTSGLTETVRRMSTLASRCQPPLLTPALPTSTCQTRSVIKWTLRKGKRKSVKAVIQRFKRLPWGGRGIWIRARAGASKKMWKKSPAQRKRCKTHVFCNATQSMMLDKMVTRFWKRTRYYPDDPYRPYMRRDTFYLTKRPREYF